MSFAFLGFGYFPEEFEPTAIAQAADIEREEEVLRKEVDAK